MFEGRYGKVLTIGLIILILIVIGTLIFFAADYIKSTKTNADAENTADRFEGSVNKQDNNQKPENKNEQVSDMNVQLNIQSENIIIDTPSNVESENTYKGFPVVGIIEIPKIDLKYPILKEVTKDSIEVSVAINSGPGLNRVGNTVIIGHNYRNATFFSNNKNLSNGDKVYITDETGTKLEYTIYNSYITTPEDSDYMDRDTGGKKEVTLVTCTDDTKSRLIICARAEG